MLHSLQVNRLPPTFRVNVRVIQMIAIAIVALAVPLTLVVLGVRQISTKPRTSAPDTAGLRLALEQVAEKSWNTPEAMADGRSIWHLAPLANVSETRRAIEESARKFPGVVLLPASAGPGGEERLLVQLPCADANRFEAESLRTTLVESQRGHASGESRLYEIHFSGP